MEWSDVISKLGDLVNKEKHYIKPVQELQKLIGSAIDKFYPELFEHEKEIETLTQFWLESNNRVVSIRALLKLLKVTDHIQSYNLYKTIEAGFVYIPKESKPDSSIVEWSNIVTQLKSLLAKLKVTDSFAVKILIELYLAGYTLSGAEIYDTPILSGISDDDMPCMTDDCGINLETGVWKFRRRSQLVEIILPPTVIASINKYIKPGQTHLFPGSCDGHACSTFYKDKFKKDLSATSCTLSYLAHLIESDTDLETLNSRAETLGVSKLKLASLSQSQSQSQIQSGV